MLYKLAAFMLVIVDNEDDELLAENVYHAAVRYNLRIGVRGPYSDHDKSKDFFDTLLHANDHMQRSFLWYVSSFLRCLHILISML